MLREGKKGEIKKLLRQFSEGFMRYIVDDLINLFFKYTLIANVLYNKPAKHMQISINTLVLGTRGRGTGRYKQRTNVWHLQ